MPSSEGEASERVERYRRRMRAQGLRPVQLWVDDVRSDVFVKAAHAQSQAVAASDAAADDEAFVEALSDGA